MKPTTRTAAAQPPRPQFGGIAVQPQLWRQPWRHLLIMIGLVIIAIIPYWQVRSFEFITYDDKGYVWDNPHVLRGLTWDNLRYAFTTFDMTNWHPLTWLSHMLDVQLFGPHPGAHHFTNVIFHAINAALVYWVLVRMTANTWPSALVSVLFALHPLHVESVAWVAERKDVLSTFFGLLAIWAYVAYVQRRRLVLYALTFMLLALSLMSKPMLVTLPFVLLLFDVWPLGRINVWGFHARSADSMGRIVLEKIPLLVLAIASSVVTLFAQRSGGAVQDLTNLPLDARLANVSVSYVQYIVKMVWPLDLALMYPLPRQWDLWKPVIALIVLIAITALTVAFSRRMPWLLVGWLLYLGTLVPVIGIVHVGAQAMADRYTYVPLLGLFIMIAWTLPTPARDQPRASAAGVIVYAIMAMVSIALGLRTWMQAGYWRDSLTLFQRTLDVTGPNPIAHIHVGLALQQRSDLQSAIEHFRQAVALQPDYRPAHLHLAEALLQDRQFESAIPHFHKSIELEPTGSRGYHGLGKALFHLGRIDDAITQYQNALEVAPGYVEAHYNLGVALMQQREAANAATHFAEAARLAPGWFDAHLQHGIALAAAGDPHKAIEAFTRAVQLRPGDPQVRQFIEAARQQQSTPDQQPSPVRQN